MDAQGEIGDIGKGGYWGKWSLEKGEHRERGTPGKGGITNSRNLSKSFDIFV